MDVETRVLSIGRLLIDRGLATEEAVAHCVAIQRARARDGDFTRIGTILVEQRVVTAEQVAQVLKLQKITILVCVICKSQYNIHDFVKNGYYECRKCRGPLKKPSSLDSLTIQDSFRERSKQKSASAPRDTVVAHARHKAKLTDESTSTRRIGNYEILGEIARGGMGVIYKARQTDLARDVALKTLNAEEARRDEAVERFHREAQAIASLRHPNLVAVHTVDHHQDIHFFTMEFVEGVPLDALLKKEGELAQERAVEIILPIVEALEYSHREGVVHRDLKPANIIIDTYESAHKNTQETPFLVDFGIAKRKGDRQLTQTGEILGSVPYMAPEYIMGDEYTEACDVYSIGICLFEALAGFEKLPFGSESDNIETVTLLKKIAYEPPEAIGVHRPDIDPLLEKVVMKAIARDLELRYESAGLLAADLRAWLKLRHDAAVVISVTPSWIWVVLVFVICLLAGNAALVYKISQRQRAFRQDVRSTLERSLVEIDRLLENGQLDSADRLRQSWRKLCDQKPWLADLKKRLKPDRSAKKEGPDKSSKEQDKTKRGG
jgi:serine/threonine protein kinase